MPISLHFEDNRFEKQPVNHIREIARAIVLDEDGNVALHLIHRDDMFGNQWYYETPGGGVDEGEAPEEAVVRECEEELGYRVEILSFLGDVLDYYNKIGRENHNHYYLCKRKEKVGIHFASSGDTLIMKTEYLPIEEAIVRMENQDEDLVAGLVKQRELPVLREALRQISALKR